MNKKIMWDKGHGGSDPGAVGNGLQEKTLTHKIVEYGMAYMNDNYTGFEQRTTRSGDQTVSLNSRDDEADKWGADVFLSVHINSGGGTGFETFIYNGGVSAATIAFQNVLHDEIMATIRSFGDLKDRGRKRANFAVIRETNMPAVLTESLFIDTSDSKYLKNEEFLKAVGEAHARGVAKYLGLKEKEKATPTSMTPSDDKFYRLVTGTFNNAIDYGNALDQLEKDFGWLVYEKAESTELNPTYRIVTGTFKGKNIAEQAAQQINEKYGWTVYVQPE